jgi:hypothetical protein
MSTHEPENKYKASFTNWQKVREEKNSYPGTNVKVTSIKHYASPYAQRSLLENPALVTPWEGLGSDWTPQGALAEIDRILAAGEWNRASGKQADVQEVLAIYGLMLTSLLLKKNQRYGNSATDPVEVFATGLSKKDRLRVRMDDKINRILRGKNFTDNEDPRVDLAGYLVLEIVLDALENLGGQSK